MPVVIEETSRQSRMRGRPVGAVAFVAVALVLLLVIPVGSAPLWLPRPGLSVAGIQLIAFVRDGDPTGVYLNSRYGSDYHTLVIGDCHWTVGWRAIPIAAAR